MKKILIILVLLLQFLPNENLPKASCANQESTCYAKALSNCTLYKSSVFQNEFKNIWFIVPETYFVKILSTVSENCYKVQYDKFVGYVEASKIVVAEFIPNVKSLENVTFDIKQTSGTQLWSAPDVSSGTILTTISAGTKNIDYIAEIYGTIPSGGISNLWYYVSYTPVSNATNYYEGYIYSENITNLSNIAINEEKNPEPEQNNNVIEKADDQAANSNNYFISSSAKTIIIALISVPIILLISIILYKFVKKLKNNTISGEFSKKSSSGNFSENQRAYSNSYAGKSVESPIDKFKMKSFVRLPKKQNYSIQEKSKRAYPEFPTYESDDDLL